MEGLRIFKKIQTWMIFLLAPLKQNSSKYKTLVVKFAKDAHWESSAIESLFLSCNVATLLALPCILPLLESINRLIKLV
jgi:hypothetical protein